MRVWVLTIIGGLAVAWIAYRLLRLAQRLAQGRRDRRPAPGIRCPACGSSRLDDYSDAESGYCLACHHVWGVKGR